MELERELEEFQIEERRDEILQRLDELCGPRSVSADERPILPKTDVHWDYVLKEMVILQYRILLASI
jgi:hypothetical protein